MVSRAGLEPASHWLKVRGYAVHRVLWLILTSIHIDVDVRIVPRRITEYYAVCCQGCCQLSLREFKTPHVKAKGHRPNHRSGGRWTAASAERWHHEGTSFSTTTALRLRKHA